jgi:hypothetical protein
MMEEEKMVVGDAAAQEEIDLFSEGAQHLKLKSHVGIGIKQTDGKIILARNQMDNQITDAIIQWVNGDSPELISFMLHSYTYSEWIKNGKRQDIDDLYSQILHSYSTNSIGIMDILRKNSYRLFSLVSMPLGIDPPPPENFHDRISYYSQVNFVSVFDELSTTTFPTFKDSLKLIPSNVKNAIKTKILLDHFVLGTSFKEEQLVVCDFFLKRGSAGGLHKDSVYYGPSHPRAEAADNIEYVSILTFESDSDIVIRGTQLVVDDLQLPQKVRDKVLVGLPTSKDSNLLFYDPAFIHCTPEDELLDTSITQQKMVEGIYPYDIKKAKTLRLSPSEKATIMQSLQTRSRQFLRCHYMPATRSRHQTRYTRGISFEEFIPTHERLNQQDMEGMLLSSLQRSPNLHINPSYTQEIDVDNVEQLNAALEQIVDKNMSMGGKRKTQKHHKQTHVTQKSKTKTKTKKHVKKIVNLKLTKLKIKLTGTEIDLTTQNLKNGIIYCKNEDIYKVLKCYTDNTIIY